MSRTIENGTECVYSYDKIGQMTNLTLRTASMPTNILQSFTYGYDVVGNRIWSKYKNGRGDVYAYDATYQIVGVKYNVTDPTVGYASAANPSKTVVYSYDALGNRTTVIEGTATNTYSINNLNLYTTNGAVAYTHDGRGNIAGDGTWTFGYDYKNHLTSANKTGMAITYAYDGMGRRLNKVVNGVKTSYIYDGMNLIEQRDGSGAVIATYIYESGIDCPLKATIGVNTYYFQRDVIGNVTALISSSGNIQEQYEYDIFGNPTIKDGSGNILSVSATPFLFTGREYDVETGLYHYRARAYSPVLGRFLQVDPIDFEGGDVNTYRYCANNPINGTDALGLLNSAQALAHYLGGSGTPLSMKFADIGGTSKVKASGFTQVKGFISKTKKIRGKCCPKTEKVDDHKAYSTSGDQALFLGNITLHLTGTWSVNEKCHWNFSGDLGAFDDTYDFNPSTHRSKTAEFLTGVGAKLPGKKYTISFTGKNSSSEDGDIK